VGFFRLWCILPFFSQVELLDIFIFGIHIERIEDSQYACFHLASRRKEMATALAITGAEAGDRIELMSESLSYGALSPVIVLAEDYAIKVCPLQ